MLNHLKLGEPGLDFCYGQTLDLCLPHCENTGLLIKNALFQGQ